MTIKEKVQEYRDTCEKIKVLNHIKKQLSKDIEKYLGDRPERNVGAWTLKWVRYARFNESQFKKDRPKVYEAFKTLEVAYVGVYDKKTG